MLGVKGGESLPLFLWTISIELLHLIHFVTYITWTVSGPHVICEVVTGRNNGRRGSSKVTSGGWPLLTDTTSDRVKRRTLRTDTDSDPIFVTFLSSLPCSVTVRKTSCPEVSASETCPPSVIFSTPAPPSFPPTAVSFPSFFEISVWADALVASVSTEVGTKDGFNPKLRKVPRVEGSEWTAGLLLLLFGCRCLFPLRRGLHRYS